MYKILKPILMTFLTTTAVKKLVVDLMKSLAKRFPGYQKAIDECGGVTRFCHIINQLKSAKPSYGLTWTSYFKECDSIRRLERIVSENCASIVNLQYSWRQALSTYLFRPGIRLASKLWRTPFTRPPRSTNRWRHGIPAK